MGRHVREHGPHTQACVDSGHEGHKLGVCVRR